MVIATNSSISVNPSEVVFSGFEPFFVLSLVKLKVFPPYLQGHSVQRDQKRTFVAALGIIFTLNIVVGTLFQTAGIAVVKSVERPFVLAVVREDPPHDLVAQRKCGGVKLLVAAKLFAVDAELTHRCRHGNN